jgi:hypothetical protein
LDSMAITFEDEKEERMILMDDRTYARKKM